MFLREHKYRTLEQDEVASVINAWEKNVLEGWDEQPNLAFNEEIVAHLYIRSSGPIQTLYKYLQQIAIAQLEHTLDPTSEEDIDIGRILGNTRNAKTYF